jgi:hypothetical protein
MKTIIISNNLYDNLHRLSNDSGYNNLDEFANFVLGEVVTSAYGGKEEELTDNKETENHLLGLIEKNPDKKEYYVAIYNYYNSKGDHLNAGNIRVQILNRFHSSE